MSTWPNAGSSPDRSSTSRRSRCAIGTPRVWMPTSATVSSSSFRSMISCAMRESVRRMASELAPEDSLEFVPSWYGERLTRLGEGHGARISIAPNTPPGLMDGVDANRAGRDQLPAVDEHYAIINDKTTNWCVVPWATVEWARVVHPELPDDAALARLWEELVYTLRLDEDDSAAAWRDRAAQLHDAALKLDAA